MTRKCPKCSSGHVDHVEEQGVDCLICLSCGYDESEELQSVDEDRPTQAGKSEHSPYKVGGHRRTEK